MSSLSSYSWWEGKGRGFLRGRGCSWSSSVVPGSEFCGRDPHRVYRFLELSLALLPLPEAGIEHRLRGRYFLQISQRQWRAFIDSSGDLWQSRSYSRFILSDGLTRGGEKSPVGFALSFLVHLSLLITERQVWLSITVTSCLKRPVHPGKILWPGLWLHSCPDSGAATGKEPLPRWDH